MKQIMKQVRLIFILLIFLSSCAQDPIFNMIANEIEPKDPKIKGSPSKLVRFNDDIYTANGKLWKYSDSNWSSIGAPSNIYDIAAGGNELYLLSVSGSNTTVYKLGGGSIWNSTGYNMIQGLYSDGAKPDAPVYAGAKRSSSDSSDYAILKITGDSFEFELAINSPLAGVADSYFATATSGIYNRSTLTLITGSPVYSIAGIIDTKPATEGVIAVTGNGRILKVTANSIEEKTGSYPSFTGALAIYKRDDMNTPFLLLGSKSGIYDLGYREMSLDGNFVLSNPGDSIPYSTVSDRDKYRSTLAKCAVNSLIQVPDSTGGPDGLPIIFASTQKDGLWSYRNNEWNAEE
ncbi:MAG: hypothetical protein LBK66_09420 [Spirochaetaceae bacterium]|jgi:hypothetical protein|nr:hypothetical protein [Spirochaetaceae bacterium]